MKVIRVLFIFVIAGFGIVQASEYYKGYDVNQPQLPKPQTQRALDYERAYNKDTKERTASLYSRFKSALGFKAAAPRPRVAEYEAAFSAPVTQKNEPWNTPWYEKRTYEEHLPVDVKKTLDAHQKELAEMGDVSSFEWLPGYIVKRDYRMNDLGERVSGDSKRIKGAKVFTRAIKEQRNPMIYIPQKYGYASTNSQGNVQGEYIISEKVPINNELITKEEAKAIEKIAYHTKWTDSASRNYVKMAPGRIAIIDTEPYFFPNLERDSLKYKINRQMRLWHEPFTPEAVDYLKNKQRQLQYKGRGWHILIPPSKKDFYSRMGL